MPVGHGYVFSMAVGTIGEWLKLVPFLWGDEQLIREGGAENKYCRQIPPPPPPQNQMVVLLILL